MSLNEAFVDISVLHEKLNNSSDITNQETVGHQHLIVRGYELGFIIHIESDNQLIIR